MKAVEGTTRNTGVVGGIWERSKTLKTRHANKNCDAARGWGFLF